MYAMEDMVTETISIALRQAANTDTFTGADLRVCKALLSNGADASFMGHYDSVSTTINQIKYDKLPFKQR